MEENKLVELKDLYDELWRDARTLVIDMNKNIRAVLLYGLLCFFVALFELSLATNNYDKFLSGVARWPIDYIYLGGGVLGCVAFVVVGVSMLWWYSTLRKRYRKLIEIEKKLGE